MFTNVLLYGRDSQLLYTRRMLLDRAGYRVVTASELSDVKGAATSEQFDLLILCHSLSMEDCGRAISLFQSRWPLAKTLFVGKGSSGCSERLLGEVIEALDGPGKLLATVSRLVGVNAMHAHA